MKFDKEIYEFNFLEISDQTDNQKWSKNKITKKKNFFNILVIFLEKIYEMTFDNKIFEIFFLSELGNIFSKMFTIIWAFTAF